jgi:hypothetical protein
MPRRLKLIRHDHQVDGIFGKLFTEEGEKIAVTLEHAYDSGLGDGSYTPKVPPGEYLCVKSQHQLHSMAHPFTTFELKKVPGHTNILLHSGNFNEDSDGCILLGQEITHTTHAPNHPGGTTMITASRVTFKKFMERMNLIDTFYLTVVG